MKKNKFYKTTVTYTFLSEEPIVELGLGALNYGCMDGALVLHKRKSKILKVNGKKMARLLCEAGSEPGFFSLDKNGNNA